MNLRTDYSISIHPAGPFDAYSEGPTGTLREVIDALRLMADVKGDDGNPVFANDDVLSVVDGEGKAVLQWSRDGGTVIPSGGIIGWQIVNKDGINVHGDGEPFDLNTFSILVGQAAEVAREWVETTMDFHLDPVFESDIQNPEFRHHLPALGPVKPNARFVQAARRILASVAMGADGPVALIDDDIQDQAESHVDALVVELGDAELLLPYVDADPGDKEGRVRVDAIKEAAEVEVQNLVRALMETDRRFENSPYWDRMSLR